MKNDENESPIPGLCGNCAVELRDCQWLLNMRPFPGSRYKIFHDSGLGRSSYDYYRMIECPKYIPVPIKTPDKKPEKKQDAGFKSFGRKRPVYSINADGVRWDYISVQEASDQTGCDVSNIVACCRGRLKTHKRLKWGYADGKNVKE